MYLFLSIYVEREAYAVDIVSYISTREKNTAYKNVWHNVQRKVKITRNLSSVMFPFSILIKN